MHKIFELIWVKEEMPEEWKHGLICPVYKKGDPMQCKSYGAITLLTTTYKVFAKILHLRLKPYAEKILGSYQSGFRQGKSTIDQIFTLRHIKIARLRWAGHVQRMKNDKIVKRIMEGKPEG